MKTQREMKWSKSFKASMRTDGGIVKRICKACQTIKALAAFYVDGKGYPRLVCKTCERLEMKKYRIGRNAKGVCASCSRPRDGSAILCRKCTRRANDNQIIRRLENKKRAVELMGGICVDCERRYENIAVYDFHHVDAESKDHSLANDGQWMAAKWERLEAELKKCVLLCANCHRIRHARERAAQSLTHSDAFVPVEHGRVIEPRRN